MFRYKYSLSSFIVLIILLYLTLKPSNGESPIDIPHIDKVAHFTFFMILSALSFMAMVKEWKIKVTAIGTFTVILLLFSVGVAIEILQLYVPGRSASVADATFDLGGALFGRLIYPLIIKLII